MPFIANGLVQFEEYKIAAEEMGFVHVASGPMVRSSYHADEFKA